MIFSLKFLIILKILLILSFQFPKQVIYKVLTMAQRIYQEIQQRLSSFEKEKNIRILFACESGSRAWGFPSTDSDYDVRFIFVHQPNWYLSINDRKERGEMEVLNIFFRKWLYDS